MPNRVITAAIASLLLAAGAVAQENPAPASAQPTATEPAKAAPKLVVEPPRLDLGKISDDKDASGTLTIRNNGDADLLISGIASTCSCTIPRFAGRDMDADKKQAEQTTATLKPGESTTLEVVYHPAGKRDEQSQKITLKSNDPARRETVVELVAMVQPMLRCDPAIINFGEVVRGEAKTVIATITGRSPGFAIPFVTTGSDAIAARVLDTVETEEEGVKVRQVRVEFTLTSPRPMVVSGMAGIRTTDPRRKLLSVGMTGAVVGDLALDPDKVAFRPATPGEVLEKTIRIRNRVGKPFKILGVEGPEGGPSPAAWEVAPAGEEAPDSQDLKLTFTAPTRPGSWKGTLVISTDVPNQEKIEVIYNGSVRSPGAPVPGGPVPGGPPR